MGRGNTAAEAMWRVVCVGPGVNGKPRRIVDKGPLHASRARAQTTADWLSATGLYESVSVVSSSIALPADVEP